MAVQKPLLRLLHLQRFPILRQLQLEEKLLRTTNQNWCIINDGTHPTSIVMGISGKPELLLDLHRVTQDRIPVIRRFSGGGTVVVDDDTLFVTLICSQDAFAKMPLFPRPIMTWTEELYKLVFQNNPGFSLQEHDYAFGDKKFGGNAQSIIKNRWLHHTSFLWDYKDLHMNYLTIPAKIPAYRLARSHNEFLCCLKDVFPLRKDFMNAVELALGHFFSVEEINIMEIDENSMIPYPRSTKIIGFDELTELYDGNREKQVV